MVTETTQDKGIRYFSGTINRYVKKEKAWNLKIWYAFKADVTLKFELRRILFIN